PSGSRTVSWRTAVVRAPGRERGPAPATRRGRPCDGTSYECSFQTEKEVRQRSGSRVSMAFRRTFDKKALSRRLDGVVEEMVASRRRRRRTGGEVMSEEW